MISRPFDIKEEVQIRKSTERDQHGTRKHPLSRILLAFQPIEIDCPVERLQKFCRASLFRKVYYEKLVDRDPTAGVVVPVEGIAILRSDGGKQAKLVIGIGLGLLACVVRRQDIARAVIGDENQDAGSDLLLVP